MSKNKLRPRFPEFFREYIDRVKDLSKSDLERMFDKKGGIADKDNKTEWDESKNDAAWTYNGSKSLRTLEDALKFCKVDLTVWEVERHLFNSWDVTNAGGVTHTNYQVKIWFVKKQGLNDVKALQIQRALASQRINLSVPKSKFQTWVVIGCVHRPFHDKKLWNGLLKLLSELSDSLTGIIINGDYLDLRSLSTHDESNIIPDGLTLSDEYGDGYKGLLEIEQAIGETPDDFERVFNYGNHEDRYLRHIKKFLNSKYGTALQSPEDGLRLKELGYKINTNWKDGVVTIGNNLDVFHGEFTGQNPCKTHIDRMPTRSCIFNHTHRISGYSNGRHTAYNIGWMGDEESGAFNYVSRHTRALWRKGFSVVYVDKNGNHDVNTIEAFDGNFFFGGKIY